MNARTVSLGSLSMCLLLMIAVHSCYAQALPDAACQQDPRLAKRITLRSPRILVGELLQQLSQRTGVTVTADADSGAGDDEVVADLHDVTLEDALNAVWSLFSYKAAVWEWRSAKVADAYTYTLVRPAGARVLAAHINEAVQNDFEAQTHQLIAALALPPDRLAEDARQDKLLSSLVKDVRVRPRMEAFISLPPELQAGILKGKGILIPVSQLSQQAQAAIQEGWEAESNGVRQYITDNHLPVSVNSDVVIKPTSLTFDIYTFPGDIVPSLTIDCGQGSGGLCGGGFLEDAWRKKLGDLWVQPGDTAESAVGAHTVSTPRGVSPEPRQGVSRVFTRRLLQMADAMPLSVLARMPDERGSGTSASDALPYGQTVQAYLTTLRGSLAVQHKWRGGVLLCSYPWFKTYSEDARAPWAEVLRLRTAEENAPGGFLPLSEIAHAAHVLAPAQMNQVGTWFGAIREAADWHDFLDYYDRSPAYRTRLHSPEGDAFRYPQDLLPASFGIEALRETHPNLRLRLVEKYDQHDDMPALKAMHIPPVYRYLLQVLDDGTGQVLTAQDINCIAHGYRDSLLVEGGGWVRGG